MTTSDSPLSNNDPVTLWMNELRGADDVAAQKLWDHFVGRLYDLCRRRLQAKSRRVYDEEDAALSAFQSVCAGIQAGRFPDLQDRNSLWQLMAVITARKITHRVRYDHQLRRDVRRNLTDSVFAAPGDSQCQAVGGVLSREPSAEFAVEFLETFERLFDGLEDPDIRNVVVLRMEGYSDSEIAAKLQCSRRTVQRRLEIVRRNWNKVVITE